MCVRIEPGTLGTGLVWAKVLSLAGAIGTLTGLLGLLAAAETARADPGAVSEKRMVLRGARPVLVNGTRGPEVRSLPPRLRRQIAADRRSGKMRIGPTPNSGPVLATPVVYDRTITSVSRDCGGAYALSGAGGFLNDVFDFVNPQFGDPLLVPKPNQDPVLFNPGWNAFWIAAQKEVNGGEYEGDSFVTLSAAEAGVLAVCPLIRSAGAVVIVERFASGSWRFEYASIVNPGSVHIFAYESLTEHQYRMLITDTEGGGHYWGRAYSLD